MRSMKPRVRFAPSPTGELHIGNARTALFNWLFARRHGGAFVLRVEDTDRVRTSVLYEQNILADLTWLSLDWDEGPDRGGLFGPYRQSERAEIYRPHLRKLQAEGLAYPCYCSVEELEAERIDLIARRMPPRYGGKCRNLTAAQREARERDGRQPTFRFLVGSGRVAFNDLIRGAMSFDCSSLGDFILMRSDGTPAYNFAVVVDDHEMEISHVIRGEDHLSNTASQVLLYNALGFPVPLFAHHALITGKDRAKLSKRHGSVSVREFRERGFLPEAIVNYLSLLGSSFGEGAEILSPDQIVREFSLEKTGRGAAIFAEDKLRWINSAYLRNYDLDTLIQALIPFIGKAGYDYDSLDPVRLRDIVAAVQGNMTLLSDMGEYLDLFCGGRHALSPEAAALLREGRSSEVVRLFYHALRSDTLSGGDLLGTAVRAVRKESGLKGKEIYMPLRAALTGATHGPELEKVVALLGREAILERLAGVIGGE